METIGVRSLKNNAKKIYIYKNSHRNNLTQKLLNFANSYKDTAINTVLKQKD